MYYIAINCTLWKHCLIKKRFLYLQTESAGDGEGWDEDQRGWHGDGNDHCGMARGIYADF